DERADHRDQARCLAVAVTDEVGDGVLAELAQVRREEKGEQHIPTGPSHEEDRAGVAVVGEGDDAGHRDERRGAHPVGRDRGTVGRSGDATASDVEAGGVGDAAPVGDEDVEAEGQSYEDQGPQLSRAHGWCTSCSYSVMPYFWSRRSISFTYTKMRITKVTIDPCWANQNPSGTPRKETLLSGSTNTIPAP